MSLPVMRCSLLLVIGPALLVLTGVTWAACPSHVCDCSSYSGTQKVVRCDLRHLRDIPLGLPDDTRILYLQHNELTKLAAEAFSRLSRLEILYLYNNRIGEIEDGAFRGLGSLTQLHLQSNNISWVTNGTFYGIPNLETLSLSNNRLSSLSGGVFSQVPLLRQLKLESNSISELTSDVAQDLANLELIDLSYNQASLLLNRIFGQTMKLQILKLNYLSANHLSPSDGNVSNLVFAGLENLRELELDGNRLDKIPLAVQSLPNLTLLSLYWNDIKSIDGDVFPEPSLIQRLELTNNDLADIPVAALEHLPYLTELYLDYNRINSIPARAFYRNPLLEYLSVSQTNLTSIDKDAFLGLGRMLHLSLEGNQLATIPDGALDGIKTSATLSLSGNPLRCDCLLRGFGAWLQNNHTGSLRGNPLNCASPERLGGTAVIDVELQQFACEPYAVTDATGVLSTSPGSDALLPCHIEADPMLNLHWITSDHEIVSPDQPRLSFTVRPPPDGSLWINNASSSHGGRYTCVVSNAAGEARSSITLRVELPSLPSSSSTTRVDGAYTVSPTESKRIETGSPVPSKKAATISNAVIIGPAAGILVAVAVLVIVAAVIVKRRPHHRRRPKPGICQTQLPAIPDKAEDRCRIVEEGDGALYAEIPADANVYCTRIVDPPPAASGCHDVLSGEITHTYLTPSKMGSSRENGQVAKGDLRVRLPEERYSCTPSPSDKYMTMKPIPGTSGLASQKNYLHPHPEQNMKNSRL